MFTRRSVGNVDFVNMPPSVLHTLMVREWMPIQAMIQKPKKSRYLNADSLKPPLTASITVKNKKSMSFQPTRLSIYSNKSLLLITSGEISHLFSRCFFQIHARPRDLAYYNLQAYQVYCKHCFIHLSNAQMHCCCSRIANCYCNYKYSILIMYKVCFWVICVKI